MILNMTEKTHDSQGSAETLARGGGITNYHLIAYSFSNISAKKYQNRVMCNEVIACNISVVFLRHSVFKFLVPRTISLEQQKLKTLNFVQWFAM